jgi:hypothetical protein
LQVAVEADLVQVAAAVAAAVDIELLLVFLAVVLVQNPH